MVSSGDSSIAGPLDHSTNSGGVSTRGHIGAGFDVTANCSVAKSSACGLEAVTDASIVV